MTASVARASSRSSLRSNSDSLPREAMDLSFPASAGTTSAPRPTSSPAGSVASLAQSRPGTPTRVTAGLRTSMTSSMTRLPSDPTDATPLQASDGSGSRPGSAKWRQQGGVVKVNSGNSSDRSPKSCPGGPSPSSGRSNGSKPGSQATMARLQEEAPAAQAEEAPVAEAQAEPAQRPAISLPEKALQVGGAAPLPALCPASEQLVTPQQSTTPGGDQSLQTTSPFFQVTPSLRERFRKELTVSVANQSGLPKQPGQTGTVFRQLKEGEFIQDMFDFNDEIYNGGEKGKVMLAKRKEDGTELVVKVRTKQPNKNTDRSWRAIMAQVHKLGGSSHVLDIIEIIEGPTDFYIVMPKCNGGELFDFLATETEVPESECKRITCEILIAVDHLHKNNLIHRDIKPENIMFDIDRTQEASPKSVKLIDFDTCLEWSPTSPKSKRFVGTPGYIAPEVLMGESSPQSDLWSVGVILYILMTGEMPWGSLTSLEDGMVGSPSAKRMYQELKSEVLEWEQEPWPDFPLARDLCQHLLAFSLEERCQTVEEALRHPWLADRPELKQRKAKQNMTVQQPGSQPCAAGDTGVAVMAV